MDTKLYNSELKILNVLWKEGELPAKDIIKILNKEVGWNKSTTYTMLKRCAEKGLIEYGASDFVCRALITREDAQKYETRELIESMYDGSPDRLIASLLNGEYLSGDDIEKLKKLINSMD